MTREEALNLIDELMKNENLLKHLLAVETAMGALAKKLGEDEKTWKLTGLLHDADFEITKDTPDKHTLVLEEKLKDHDLPQEVIKAIKAHNRKYTLQDSESRLDWALQCADDVTGLIITTALVMPDKKLASVRVESVLKKFKDKAFAKGVDRERIKLCEEKLQVPLEEFVKLSLKALQEISSDLNL